MNAFFFCFFLNILSGFGRLDYGARTLNPLTGTPFDIYTVTLRVVMMYGLLNVRTDLDAAEFGAETVASRRTL